MPRNTKIVQTRPIYEIAAEIRRDHRETGQKVYFGLVPYLAAMECLDRITDYYGDDSATEILTYGKSNMQSWKGETARRVKKEIAAMLPW